MTVEEKAKELCNQYHRKWRAKNKDKVRERNKRYWGKKAIQAMQKEQESKS